MKSRPAVRPPSIASVSQPHPGCVQAQRPSVFLKNQCIRNRGKRVLSPHNSRNANSPCVAVRVVSPGESSPKRRRPNSVRLVARVVSPSIQAASNRAPACQPGDSRMPSRSTGEPAGATPSDFKNSAASAAVFRLPFSETATNGSVGRYSAKSSRGTSAAYPGIICELVHLDPKNSERKRRLSGLSGSSDALEPNTRSFGLSGVRPNLSSNSFSRYETSVPVAPRWRWSSSIMRWKTLSSFF